LTVGGTSTQLAVRTVNLSATQDAVQLPAGIFDIHFTVADSAQNMPNPPFTLTAENAASGTTVSLEDSILTSGGLPPSDYEAHYHVKIASSGLAAGLSTRLVLQWANGYAPGLVNTAIGRIEISSLFAETEQNQGTPFQFSLDDQLVMTMRPAGMSVRFTPGLSQMLEGGRISANLLPGKTCDASWFTNNPGQQPGQLQFQENLAKTDQAYTSRFGEGAYCFFLPEKLQDLEFRSPDELNNSSLPCVAIAGVAQLQGTSAFVGNLIIGQLVVIHAWELELSYALFPLSPPPLLMEKHWAKLMNTFLQFRPAYGNPSHETFLEALRRYIKRVAAGVTDFAARNPELISAAKTIGKAGATFLLAP